MKKTCLTSLLLLILMSYGFSQDKIERFCTVHLYSNGSYSKLISTRIDYGQNTSSAFRDSSVRNGLQSITSLKTETEVLNRMAAMGWSLFSVIPSDHFLNTCIFKKEFNKNDLVNSSPK